MTVRHTSIICVQTLRDYSADLFFFLVRAYSLKNCADTGEDAHYITIPAGKTTEPHCFAQNVGSVKFL